MERRMEPQKPDCGGAMKQNGNEHFFLRPFPANEQFSKRYCTRCAGLVAIK